MLFFFYCCSNAVTAFDVKEFLNQVLKNVLLNVFTPFVDESFIGFDERIVFLDKDFNLINKGRVYVFEY